MQLFIFAHITNIQGTPQATIVPQVQHHLLVKGILVQLSKKKQFQG